MSSSRFVFDSREEASSVFLPEWKHVALLLLKPLPMLEKAVQRMQLTLRRGQIRSARNGLSVFASFGNLVFQFPQSIV